MLQCLSKRASNVCATHTERVVTHRLSPTPRVAVAVAEELGRRERIGGRGGRRGRVLSSSEHFNIWARRAFEVAGVGGARGQEEAPTFSRDGEEEGEARTNGVG